MSDSPLMSKMDALLKSIAAGSRETATPHLNTHPRTSTPCRLHRQKPGYRC